MPLAAPTLTGTAGDRKVTLAWKAVTGAKSYRALRGSSPTSLSTIGVRTTALTYEDTTVANGTPYFYAVRAIDLSGRPGPNSNVVPLTPKADSLDVPPIPGHGKDVTGGGSAPWQKVTTIAEWLEAIADTGARRIYGDGTPLIGAGQVVKPRGDLTFRGVRVLNVHHRFTESNVRGHDFAFLLDDVMDAPDDADALTINAQDDFVPIEPFGFSNGWCGGGTDMAGLACLGPVYHISLHRMIFGPGLVQSRHAESPKHNRTVNFSVYGVHAGGAWGKYQTLHESLILGGDHRNPDVKYSEFIDVVRNVIYNQGPRCWRGNPRGMNGLYNRIVKGPQTTDMRIWRPEIKTDEGETPFAGSVYMLGNVGEGIPSDAIEYAAGSKRTTPYGTPSIQATAAPSVEELLGFVGPTGLNAFQERLLGYVRDRSWEPGGYYNGPDFPAPHLAW